MESSNPQDQIVEDKNLTEVQGNTTEVGTPLENVLKNGGQPSPEQLEQIMAMLKSQKKKGKASSKNKLKFEQPHEDSDDSDDSDDSEITPNNSPRASSPSKKKHSRKHLQKLESELLDSDDDEEDEGEEQDAQNWDEPDSDDEDDDDLDVSYLVEQLTDCMEQLFRDSNGNNIADIMTAQYNEMAQLNETLKTLTKVIVKASKNK